MSNSLLRTCLLLLVLLAAFILPGGVTAQGDTPATALKARLWTADDPAHLPPMPAAGKTLPQVEAAGRTMPNELGDWTRLAFQSYRDGNWEIYLAHGDGTQPVRLTNHAADDIRPRLNRGADKIAFVSNRGGNYDIYTMNADGSAIRQLTTHGPSDSYPAWSPDGARIVFAYFKDEDWEIYVMNADGSGQTRLTYGNGPDLMPAWSPDGRQIAWVRRSSNGFARLMVMNADGSNQRPLTAALKYLQFPAWSPDGSQIALDYDADGDDWNELAVIGRDGSGLHTIYDPGGALMDAWQGSWAPDGTKLLCSLLLYVVQNSQLYIAAAGPAQINLADGIASLLPGSGVDMAFDWQTADIWPPASSVAALPTLSPGPFTVSWSGTDAGPAGIAGYDVQVRDGASGAWTDWQTGVLTTSAAYPGVGGHTYYFRVRARDEAGHVESWPADYDAVTTVEALPPMTAVAVLPTYLRNGSPIRWDGYDLGGSGIRSYDVQYRDLSTADWVDWQMGTSITTTQFFGTPGHRYAFRSRATDEAGNIESWPAGEGDTSTIIYSWAVTGKVQGVRERVIAGAEAQTVPEPLARFSSDTAGIYQTYVATAADTYLVSWRRTGYTSLPLTAISGAFDTSFDAILPAGDNKVMNWGFETGTLAPEWRSSGEIAPGVITGGSHTGALKARLGALTPPEASWEYVMPSWQLSYSPSWAVDAIGKVYLAWAESGNGGDVFFATRDPSSGWSTPLLIAPGDYLHLGLDSSGSVHLIWSYYDGVDGSRLYYARRDAAGVWSAPLFLDAIDSDTNVAAPVLAVDDQGGVHVIWMKRVGPDARQLYHRYRSPTGIWSQTVNLSEPGCFSGFYPRLAVSADRTAHVAWQCSVAAPDGVGIIYRARTPDGVWSAAENVSISDPYATLPRLLVDVLGQVHLTCTSSGWPVETTMYAIRSPEGHWQQVQLPAGVQLYAMAFDGLGTLHVAWSTGPQVKYRQRFADGSWGPESVVSAARTWTEAPTLTVTPNGIAHVLWRDGVWYEPDLYYARQGDDGSWGLPQNIGDTPVGSNIGSYGVALDATGQAHLVWLDKIGDRRGRLHYGRPTIVATTADSRIVQTVVVGAEMAAPTLSLFYTLETLWNDPKSGLFVRVENEISSTLVFSATTPTNGWRHVWFDLSPWAGQTVTLTFNVHQEAGGPVAWAYLDEVTVGSGAYPDLWTAAATQVAAPGDNVTFTLPYGNRGEALAHGATLTVTLPTGLTFVSADPPPAATGPNVTWSLGDLPAATGPAAITLVASVSPTAPPGFVLTGAVDIASATNEIETADNAASLLVYVGGARRYLPLALAAGQ